MDLNLCLFGVILLTICSRRTFNVLAGFFITLMWVGYLTTLINVSLGVVFILIYISAIAVVLISVVLAIGANISGIVLDDLLLLLAVPLLLFMSFNVTEPLIVYPQSISSMGLFTLANDLLIHQSWLTLLLGLYFFSIGILLTSSFFKSLYKKTNAGLRGPSLNITSSTTLTLS